jgi:hypothetical protein
MTGSASRPLVAVLLVAGPLALVTAAPTRPALPAAVEAAIESIRADDLRPRLRRFASDEMQGRGLGHPGNDRAVAFLEEELARIGVAPAANGSLSQAFPVLTSVLGKGNALEIGAGGSGQASPVSPGEDFYPLRSSPSGTVTGDLVFVGYGITAPDFQYDDYEGVDVAGKIAVALAHEPEELEDGSRFSGRDRTIYSTAARKAATAAEHGAAALIIVPDVAHHGSGSLSEFSRVWPSNPSVQSRQFALADRLEMSPLPAALVSVPVAERLLADGDRRSGRVEALQRTIDEALEKSGKDGRIQAPASRALPGRRATLTLDIEHRRIEARNVIGMVAGSDPDLRSESIVVAAHLDHEGLDATDRIFNGADDDGSGTVAVLDIAEAAVQAFRQGARPKRTLVFALWNGEEKGSLGSEHFIANPLPAATRPVVNLNMDMIGRSEDVPDATSPRFRGLRQTSARQNGNVLHLLGYTYTPELSQIVQEENAAVGLTIKTEYDDNPQDLLRRSDQWTFLRRRIPALFFTTGLHPDYHTPDDDVEKIEFGKIERIARLVYQVAWRLADAPSLPRYVDPAASAPDTGAGRP